MTTSRVGVSSSPLRHRSTGAAVEAVVGMVVAVHVVAAVDDAVVVVVVFVFPGGT